MTPIQKWLFHISNGLVGLTGLIYGYMRYLLQPENPWDIANHPLQTHVQHLHILVAPILTFAMAWIFQSHVVPKLEEGLRRGKRSGLLLIYMTAPMIFSGYLIQTSMENFWRNLWIVVHCSTSTLWLFASLVHLFKPRTKYTTL